MFFLLVFLLLGVSYTHGFLPILKKNEDKNNYEDGFSKVIFRSAKG